MTSEELFQTISSLRSRGEIKRFANKIGKDKSLLHLYNLLLQKHRIDSGLPIKKTIRMLLNRSEQAQQRKNPIHIDVAFQCEYCGRHVPKGGSMIRDHCPYCLRSLHLDIVPGDRAATCGGVMHPKEFELNGDQVWIHYQCSLCEHQWRVRAHPDDAIPKSLSVSDITK